MNGLAAALDRSAVVSWVTKGGEPAAALTTRQDKGAASPGTPEAGPTHSTNELSPPAALCLRKTERKCNTTKSRLQKDTDKVTPYMDTLR